MNDQLTTGTNDTVLWLQIERVRSAVASQHPEWQQVKAQYLPDVQSIAFAAENGVGKWSKFVVTEEFLTRTDEQTVIAYVNQQLEQRFNAP